jgi:putative Mg2+ transporter-C (MgtC) family protein
MDTGDQLAVIGRILLATFLGGVIGMEREVRGHPAGVRTMALVALGAALFTDVSLVTGVEDRIAAGIVTGIGFIGAGVSWTGQTVEGITTAATIWSAAAIGMAVGRELYLVAGATAVVIVAVLEARPLADKLETVFPVGHRKTRHMQKGNSEQETDER